MKTLMRKALVALALLSASCGGGSAPAPRTTIASSASADPKTMEDDLRRRGVEPVTGELRIERAPVLGSGQAFETVEITVDLRNPQAQRQLVPYLIKTDVWWLMESKLMSPTTRYYRFVRATSPKEAPEIDPLRPPQRPR